MKRFLRHIILFIVFALPAYTVMLYCFGQYLPWVRANLFYKRGSYGHIYTRLQEAGTIKDADILFVGSSQAYRGFDTRIFKKNGISSFNLGSSSQTPLQTRFLLQRYLCDMKPRLIIYAVSPSIFCLDGVESSLDLIANDKTDINTLKMTVKQNHIKVYNTLLYASVLELLGTNKSFKEPLVKKEDTYIEGGYVERKELPYKEDTLVRNEYGFKTGNIAAFKSVVRELEEKQIPLILVYAPITKDNYKRFPFNVYFDSSMSCYAPYYNFNEILQLAKDDFYDQTHLNQHAVVLFNNMLLQILRDKAFL